MFLDLVTPLMIIKGYEKVSVVLDESKDNEIKVKQILDEEIAINILIRGCQAIIGIILLIIVILIYIQHKER
jgi:type III secretory pathway lipoprotein EscJ